MNRWIRLSWLGRHCRLRFCGAALALGFVLASVTGAGAQAALDGKPSSETSAARPDLELFRHRVLEALRSTNSEHSFWGILIADRDTGMTLYEWNADQFFMPASNAKLFTTALALAQLRSDYRFHTTLESKAALGNDGRLSGDLVLVGRGDPNLSNRKIPYVGGASEREGITEKVLAEMADRVVAEGLKEIDGDIVADDRYFPYDPYPAAWTVGDLYFRFGAPVDAIAFNDNTVSIDVLAADRIGEPAIVRTQPAAAVDSVSYDIRTGPRGSEPDLAVVRQPGEKYVLLRGTVPLGHQAVRLDLAMLEPARTAALTLKQLLEARGVQVTGGTQVRHSPPPETSASGEPILTRTAPQEPESNPHVLAEHVSLPLLESVRVTNKVSQNLHAELLLRTVGRVALGLGSTAAGLQVERDFFHQAGIADGDVVLTDGSGLARNDLVTPRAVVALLTYVANQPWGADYISTLPVAGVDGTLENRMVHTAASNRIQAKTGEVEHERGLSGYATTLGGEHLIFSIFYNNNPQKGPETAAPIDLIATAMVETLGMERAAPNHP
ncbi:MAG TPA: D-alanyl-D-alanine carboxypeptidase/D-alanyl-D-alanine-endopeptidase [Candidatus Acidoferrales bacterium]|nr:D-alanyl-D-alanine carboxypeptidase/D-alanyl-D-alanine-endopeptidase [Candidatus Acidoferrales bacterium]